LPPGCIVLANCPFHCLGQRHRSLVRGMNLDLLTGLTGHRRGRHLSVRLDPTEGLCCVRLEPS
jgi:predicted ArsR family transcriptional regulator